MSVSGWTLCDLVITCFLFSTLLRRRPRRAIFSARLHDRRTQAGGILVRPKSRRRQQGTCRPCVSVPNECSCVTAWAVQVNGAYVYCTLGRVQGGDVTLSPLVGCDPEHRIAGETSPFTRARPPWGGLMVRMLVPHLH